MEVEFCKHAIPIVQRLAERVEGDGIPNFRLFKLNKETRTRADSTSAWRTTRK
jgi:hypothetical protein